MAFSDAAVGGSAGIYLAKLFVEMGLADEIARKGMPQQSGGEVANRVANGEADIGMTLIAEIVPIQGARVIGPLPAPLGNDTTYAAAVTAGSAAQGRRGRRSSRALTHPSRAQRLGGGGIQAALTGRAHTPAEQEDRGHGTTSPITVTVISSTPSSPYSPRPTANSWFKYLVCNWPATSARFISDAISANQVARWPAGA